MLPFTDIDFFLFAGFYVLVIWVFKLFNKPQYFSHLTFLLTLIYLVFYYKYTGVALLYFLASYCYVRFLSVRINHRLISALILAIPMILLKAHVNPSLLHFAGFSFVSFRAMQVCIDYDSKVPLNPLHFFNFLFFIPSLYIGPLDRYKRFTDNLKNIAASLNQESVFAGLEQLTKGLLYKFVIAELILRYWLKENAHNNITFFETWNDMYAYTFYLFFDFAGYSAMAVGLANLVGINLPFNFNAPFAASNPPEFWQRWHASLTNWLTDYFFKPLYKWLGQLKRLKKHPLTRQNIAIFFTFLLMGIWNGFEPNFVWSGILYGVYSVFYNSYITSCRKNDRDVFFGTLNSKAVKYISVFILFNFVCFALYVFSGRL